MFLIKMKAKVIVLVIIVIVAGFIGFFRTPQHKLTSDYPVFLEIDDKNFIENRIDKLDSGKNLDGEQILWKLLWTKKDNFRKDYLTFEQRKRLIKKVASFSPSNYDEVYLKFNILKYKLGVNNMSQLKRLHLDKGVCDKESLYFNSIDWDDVYDVSTYFDVAHFCGFNYSEDKVEKLSKAIETTEDEMMAKHAKEHGVNEVRVYINNCENATGANEKYHCLFFQRKNI